ncbi:hypothetical protein [Bacillus sp. 3255]|uniref:hypothetical protein n=1 Tax=Bacillus sp. 3255 TaxID=2817904 RepID=UPI0028574FCF|nr:hypothetical protein [Bacillus sp. 3255]MDR6883581.1 hypothetical protein [Bacillus sp. 3255]
MAAPTTNEELTLIRESVLLPFLVPIVTRNIGELEAGHGKDALLNRLYLTAALRLLDDIEADIRRIKKTLKDQNIRVWEDDKRAREEGARYYRFLCRGYEDGFGIMREIAKAEIGTRLKLYTRKIEEAFSQRK